MNRTLIWNFNTEYAMLRLYVSDTSTLTSIAFLSHLLRRQIFLEALNFPELVVYLVKYLSEGDETLKRRSEWN